MSKSRVKCENQSCGKTFIKENGEIKRSKRLGRNQYCCRTCFGISEGKNAFDHVSTENDRKNRDNIRKHAGNRKDEFTSFRYFVKVMKNANRSREFRKGLSLEYLKSLWEKQNGICPLTGWALKLPNGTTGFNEKCGMRNASLDRIDSSKGYEEGNVRFVAYIANIARVKYSDEELFEFCLAVSSTL